MSSVSDFDKVAHKFWQDYQKGVPIGGGMAYEEKVRACELDETMDSLKRLDKLLITLKQQLADQQALDEQHLLKQTQFRHLILFLGFYVGRVVANYRPNTEFSWLGFEDLAKRYEVDTASHDKFYKVAGFCPDTPEKGRPFFVWLSLGARFFGGFHRQLIDPATGVMMPESLYWATMAYFDELDWASGQSTEVQPKVTPQDDNHHLSSKQTAHALSHATYKADATSPPSSPPSTPIESLSSTPQKALKTALTTPSSVKKSQKTASKDPFDEVKVDLVNMPAQNANHHEQYLKIVRFLQQNDQLMQTAALDEQKKHQVGLALTALDKLAQAGNTNAMLSLAIYAFEGRLLDDAKQATDWVKHAADLGDVRAQKLLSRLYFQGLGVTQSTHMGQMWLSRAAEGGHETAKVLQQQMSLVKSMKETYRSEIQQDKRTYLLIVAIGIMFVLIIWLSTKLIV